MVWQDTPYTVPLLLAALVAAALAAYVWRTQRHSRGALAFVGVQLGAACWSLGTALELASAERAAKLLAIQVQYLGIVTIPAMWLLFVLRYVGRGALARRLRPALAVVPVITLALVATVDRHRLIYDATEMVSWHGGSMLVVHYGPWFWIYAVYSYGLLLLGSLILLPVVWRSPHLYRGQALVVLVGAGAPWLGNALYIFGLSPFPHLDLTPFGFMLMGAAVTWGLFRYRLLGVVPVARHAVVEQLGDGVIVLDPEGRIVDANPAALDLTGQPAGGLVGGNLDEAFARVPAVGALLRDGVPVDTEVALSTGEQPRICHLSVSPFHDFGRSRSGRILVLRDITERKHMEESMVRAQRLSAAGELSLGISHNLNNLLSGILAPAQMLQAARPDDPEAARHLQTVIESTQRARDLVRRLGLTVRDDEDDPLEPVSVPQVVDGAVDLSRPRWHDERGVRKVDIEVDVDLDPDLPMVAGSVSGLHNAVLNLLLNAVDALPEGGAITVRARREADRVVLRVRDDGRGMEEAVRTRVFEPFFTTKGDVGTGLGLATVYATVTRWGGSIDVDSAPGRGTAFTLRLPVWHEPLPAGAAMPPAPVPEAPSPARGRVLVVEDEAIVGLVLEDALRGDGHEVVLCDSAAKARQRFDAEAFDLIVADLGIPDESGDQLVRDLRGRQPDLPALLLSGWHLIAEDPRLEPFDDYLQKPVDVRQVRRAVQRLLSAPSPRD